jgi:hypothetical protein
MDKADLAFLALILVLIAIVMSLLVVGVTRCRVDEEIVNELVRDP